MSVASYRELAAWQKAMDLVEAVYRISQQWPRARAATDQLLNQCAEVGRILGGLMKSMR